MCDFNSHPLEFNFVDYLKKNKFIERLKEKIEEGLKDVCFEVPEKYLSLAENVNHVESGVGLMPKGKGAGRGKRKNSSNGLKDAKKVPKVDVSADIENKNLFSGDSISEVTNDVEIADISDNSVATGSKESDCHDDIEKITRNGDSTTQNYNWSNYTFLNNKNQEDIIDDAAISGIDRFVLSLKYLQEASISNPIRVRKAIESKVSNSSNIIEIKPGLSQTTVTTNDAKTAKEIIAINCLEEFPVSSRLILSSITNKFVIRSVPLCYDLDIIKDSLVGNNLKFIEIKRLPRKNISGVLTPSLSILVFAIGHVRPEKVVISKEIFEVYNYIEPITICLNCFRFGHRKKNCHSKDLCCSKCLGNHVDNNCQNNCFKCRNCGGEHSSFDKSCVARIKEIEVLSIKNSKHISRIAAHKFVKSKVTYAKVLANDTVGTDNFLNEDLCNKNWVSGVIEEAFGNVTNLVKNLIDEKFSIIESKIDVLEGKLADLKKDDVQIRSLFKNFENKWDKFKSDTDAVCKSAFDELKKKILEVDDKYDKLEDFLFRFRRH